MTDDIDRTVPLTRPEVDLLYEGLDALTVIVDDSMIDGYENARLKSTIKLVDALKVKIRESKNRDPFA